MIKLTEIENLIYKKIAGYDYLIREFQTEDFLWHIDQNCALNENVIIKAYDTYRFYTYNPLTDSIRFDYHAEDFIAEYELDHDGEIIDILINTTKTVLKCSDDSFLCGSLCGRNKEIDIFIASFLPDIKDLPKNSRIMFKKTNGFWVTFLEDSYYNRVSKIEKISTTEAELFLIKIFGL